MALSVVRHAHAGRRSDWSGEDRLRPLSPKGLAQSATIAELVGAREPTVILCSPAVRCMQTVAPLAAAAGLDIETEPRLFEGVRTKDVRSLLDEYQDHQAVLCTHGDVIPSILQLVIEAGMTPDRSPIWQKGSTWIIERGPDGWGRGRYEPPRVAD